LAQGSITRSDYLKKSDIVSALRWHFRPHSRLPTVSCLSRKMVCLPATQCCCGCSLSVGVKIIMILHLLADVAIVISSGMNIVFGLPNPFMVVPDFNLESAMLFYGLAGLPIIVTALYGAWCRDEVKVRLYFFYMLLTMVFLTVLVFQGLVFTDICNSLPEILAEEGKAWACGVARYFRVFLVSVFLGIIAYATFIMKSYGEDLAEGAAGPELYDLTWNKSPDVQPSYSYGSVQGLGEHVPGEFNTIFETACSDGLGGSKTIFNGKYHDLAYPPAHLGGV